MREIKFRAWCKQEKCFVTDFIIDRLGNEYQYNKCEFWGDDRDVILMQYTGLKDKNGVEIYEGDVCAAPYVDPKGNVHDEIENIRFAVIEKHGCFGYEKYDFFPLVNWCRKSVGRFVSNYGEVEVVEDSVLWVIGNIHEHSHLLNQGKYE
jgi:uncharacterized phage protein (TIGR01671 family)